MAGSYSIPDHNTIAIQMWMSRIVRGPVMTIHQPEFSPNLPYISTRICFPNTLLMYLSTFTNVFVALMLSPALVACGTALYSPRSTITVIVPRSSTSRSAAQTADKFQASTITFLVIKTHTVFVTDTTTPPKMPGLPADLMTIAVTNQYGRQMSLSLASNANGPSPIGNPSPNILPDASLTQFTFPTGWAGRICVGPDLNPNGSKIEGSFTGPPDIDVSYVDGYTVPIICLSEGVAVTGCNIELFNQPNVRCEQLIDRATCLNPAKDVPDGPAPPFFKACAGAAYTYPNDNTANRDSLSSNLISCCVGRTCQAPARQPGGGKI